MLDDLHPLVAGWFSARYGAPTEPQVHGWPLIRAGRDVLISAPTGSGKTLAAFTIALDGLVRRAASGGGDELPDHPVVLYVSPLKALTNDVRKNLEVPLAELRERAASAGLDLAPIRTATRTGDTPAADRAKMLRKPPHVLVTTPESLFILLTAERSRALLAHVETVIVDEIHAMAGDKRGAHLALTLARLDALVVAEYGGRKPQRIGLSATVRPLETVARFLSDDAQIVDVGSRRAMTLAVEIPQNDELGPIASRELWDEVYDRIAQLVSEHETTLVFVPTRRMSERIAFALGKRLGPGVVLPHHGSLAREIRLETENSLKDGKLRAVVATASLELGIDIGSVDLVVQIGSPRAIATALQRIGRSGHWVGAKPEGRIFATTRDELLECAALVRALRGGAIDALRTPRAPLDILAQQIVAATGAGDWNVDELFAVILAADPYRNLDRKTFDDVLTMLADGVATSRGRAGAFVHFDRVNGRLRGRRGARMAAITAGGAIPETANYNVVAEPEGVVVGNVDEDFAIESMSGDIFLLGTTSWLIKRVEAGVVRVENANGAPPSIPFWNGEGLGRTIELSAEVAALRSEIDARIVDDDAIAWLIETCALDRAGAEQAVAYVRAGKAALGAVPTATTLIAERFFDEAGGMQLVLHTPFGARINRAWGLALRKKFCRTFDIELQAAATDNGIVLSLSDRHAFALDAVWEYVKSASVRETLVQALLPAPMFAARWRWNATRSLAILRSRAGRKVAPQLLRMKAEDLLAACFPDAAACQENVSGPIRVPDHVLVRETIDNCLNEAMDIEGLLGILRGIEGRAIRTLAVDTAEASPFSHEILNASPYAFLDDAPLEERRTRAVTMRRTMRDEAGPDGILDPAAIAEVAAQSWPLVRDPDELHDALATLVVVPPLDEWRAWFDELVAAGRGTVVTSTEGQPFWTCAERARLALLAYPGATLAPAVDVAAFAGGTLPETREAAFAEILRGWLESSGPTSLATFAERFAIDETTLAIALAQLETEGQVFSGAFRGEGVEWVNRRVLARIHRLTLGTLRREIEPVSTADFVRFLFRWQHVAPGTQLHGVDGTLAVIRQLEGFEVPAAAWETTILPARVVRYRHEYLDKLCLAGDVMWGRLSPHAALAPHAADAARRRIRPTKLAPISLFERADAESLLARGAYDSSALSPASLDVLAEIERRGAPFFADIARGTRRLPSEIEEALWELVAAGLVTADGFDALRALADRKRRLGEKGVRARPRSSSGRWTLLASATDRERIDVEAFARRLLARYGVVFRDIVARESVAPSWRELLGAFRRLEARGEIRGGRFVAGYVGEQFALPDAIDALRAARRSGEPIDVEVSMHDPLALPRRWLAPQRETGDVIEMPNAAAAARS